MKFRLPFLKNIQYSPGIWFTADVPFGEFSLYSMLSYFLPVRISPANVDVRKMLIYLEILYL